MGIGLGLVAIVLAAFIAWKEIGPDAVSSRVAAVLALVGVQAAVAPTRLGEWLQGLSGDVRDLTARAVGTADAAYAAPVRLWLVPLVVLVVGTMWLAAMLPTGLSRWLGGIVNESFSSGLIWSGAVVLGIFLTAAPGAWGNLLVTGVDILGGVAASGIRAAVA